MSIGAWIFILLFFNIVVNAGYKKIVEVQGTKMVDELNRLQSDYINLKGEELSRASFLSSQFVRWLGKSNRLMKCRIAIIFANAVMGILAALESRYSSYWSSSQSTVMWIAFYVTSLLLGFAVQQYYRCRWARNALKKAEE